MFVIIAIKLMGLVTVGAWIIFNLVDSHKVESQDHYIARMISQSDEFRGVK